MGSFSNGLPVQPGFDHATGTASGKCLVTGNAQSTIVGANQTDVDNGITTVITPSIDLTGLNDPIVEYFRWYGNNEVLMRKMICGRLTLNPPFHSFIAKLNTQ